MMNSFSVAASLKSKRKPNFTDDENLFLIGEFEKNREVLRSKVNSTEINKRKLDVWQRICDKLNSRNLLVKRSVDEVRRKWKNMVTTARKDAANFNPNRPPSEVSQRIMRGYCETDAKYHDQPNNGPMASPLGSDSGASGETGVEIIVQQENIDGVKEENHRTNQINIDMSSTDEIFPRIDEVRAAVGCGMEIVEPGPPAAALTAEQSRPGMRRPNNVPLRPKRNNIQAILYNAKKRKLQATQNMASTTSLDIQQLQKEKLVLEKEKIVMEKEKLMLEKEKLMLEIQCLKYQLNGEESEY